VRGFRKIPFVGGAPAGELVALDGLAGLANEGAIMKIARIPVADLPPGVPGLVRWVKRVHPSIYRALAARMAVSGQIAGLGLVMPDAAATPVAAADSKAPGIANTILSSLTDLIKVGIPAYQQNQIFKLQLDRARKELPPLDTTAISDAAAFRVAADSGTKNTAMIVAGTLAVGLVGFALLRK
jgi:hypothetical protein